MSTMRLFLLVAAAYGALSVNAAPADRVHRDARKSSDQRIQRRRIPPSHTVHERHEPQHTDGWTRAERADPVASLPMRIGLKQSNLDLGHELLMNL